MKYEQSNKQRVVLVSELFYPEQTATAYIMTKIARELNSEFSLLILTVTKKEHAHCLEQDRMFSSENTVIKRILLPAFDKNKLVFRTIRLLLATLGLGLYTLLFARRSDIVFTVTNPAPLILLLAIVQKIRGFKLVFLVHDIFPENATAAGIITSKGKLYSWVKKSFDWAYSVADLIITIGRDMSEIISQKCPGSIEKITLIENWAEKSLMECKSYNSRSEYGSFPSKNIVIQYAGNIGRTQGLLDFLDIVSETRNKCVDFNFRGTGALFDQLKSKISDRSNFSIAGGYSRREQVKVLENCDIALVILSRNMYGLGVPSKTYNLMALGKPILYVGPVNSEIYRLVVSEKIGWAFSWDEQEELIQFVNNLSIKDKPKIASFGDKAKKLAQDNFNEEGQLSKFRKCFCEIRDRNET